MPVKSFVLAISVLLCATQAWAQLVCSPDWTPAYKCMQHCGPCPSTSNANSSSDNPEAQRAQAAAAVQRQREAELEQQRIAAETQRRIEELANQAKFVEDRDTAACALRSTTGNTSPCGPGEQGLRGSTATPELHGLKADTTENPSLDPRIVDARHVPTGLPKVVDAEIPNTPAGDRVRKGFEAIVDHDWNVAHAWFQDALNHDPGNPGIQRLIALAEYTLNRAKYPRPHPSAALVKRSVDAVARDQAREAALDQQLDEQMNADLAKALDDFNRNYLPKHPELLQPKPSASAPKERNASAVNETSVAEQRSKWKVFFDAIFSTASSQPRRPGSVAAPRD